MTRTSEKQLEAVSALDGPARLAHFVKRVADSERAWGVWQDRWMLVASGDGSQLFPLWPAREYAERHCSGEWAACVAREIPLSELLADEGLPLEPMETRLCIFAVLGKSDAVVLTFSELRAALKTYLDEWYGEA